MGDKTRGLYPKFRVERTDYSHKRNGKHWRCDYFVLDLTHDPFAAPALVAYIEACKEEYPLLARDLQEKVDKGIPFYLNPPEDFPEIEGSGLQDRG